jgi:hypothetical protein
MVKHIYGKIDLLKTSGRPHVFINELKLYINYLKKDIDSCLVVTEKKAKQLTKFKEQLLIGIAYYNQLLPTLNRYCETYIKVFENDLKNLRMQLIEMEDLVPTS